VILRGQGEDLEQALDRVPVGPVQAPLQVPQPAHTQPGPLGQFLLGEPGQRTMTPEQLTELGRPINFRA
jgi:hypothetical protein